VCIALCTIVAHNIAQNRPDSFPLTLQTITTAQMMSIWGKGGGLTVNGNNNNSNNNKWSKNFDDRPHRRGISHWENLMWHSTASATGQSERTLQAADVLYLACSQQWCQSTEQKHDIIDHRLAQIKSNPSISFHFLQLNYYTNSTTARPP